MVNSPLGKSDPPRGEEDAPFRGNPDILPSDTRLSDTISTFSFITIDLSGVCYEEGLLELVPILRLRESELS